MARPKNPEDLTAEELRRLLVEKRRSVRKQRIERFRETGRIVTLVPDERSPGMTELVTAAEDEPDEPARYAGRSRTRRVFDGLLLFVEVAAVLILGFVLFNGFEILRTLNEEVAGALVQPTFTPTPLIIAAVLPSGHTPPDSPGGARPNDAEIPEHLRPLVQSLAEIPIPTPAPEHAIQIQIPAIGVDAPIVQGDGWEQLKKGVAQHIGSANPGTDGNVVLSAHNDIFGEIFRDLDQLNPGDVVIIYTNQRSYTYVITGWDIVPPTQVEVMAPTRDPTVTLISCYPYRVDTERIVVRALLQEG
jgi:sortase A